jgi:hypothetical protein
MLSPYPLTTEVRGIVNDSLDAFRPIYAPLASPTFTGTVTTAALNVGGTSLAVDSLGLVGGDLAFYDGADTLGLHLLASDVLDLSDYAVMLADSLTQWVSISQLVDSLDAFSGGLTSGQVATQINDTIVARLNDAVTGIRLVDSTGTAAGSYVSGYTFTQGMQNKVNISDSTGNAAGNYVTRKALVDSLAAVGGGVSIGDVRDEIADSLNVLRPLYVAVADTATMLSPYALTTALPAAGVSIGDVRDEIADSLNVLREDILTESDLRKFSSDTTTLFVFGAGSGGAEADTALFTTSNIYGSFYNAGSDTLVVTSLRAVMIAGTTPSGTDTLSIHVYWNDTINVTGGGSVKLNTDPLVINSTTTGTVDASFNNSLIPPNVWVFCKSPGVVTGRKPKALIVNLSGYKRNRSY